MAPDNPAPGIEEGRLLERCLHGSPEAWEEFIRRYHPALEGAVRFTFLRCIHCIPEADVANVVQDLYARLYEDDCRRLRTFQGRCPVTLWLKSLAVRQTLNTIRDEKLRGRYGGGSLDDRPLQPAAPDPEHEPAEDREEIARLEELMDRLGPLQRTALKMFYIDGLSYRQIARALGVTVQTVGSLISRGRDRLREMLHRREPDQ